MKASLLFKKISSRELVFVILLNILVFIFYAFDKRIPGFQWHQILFYLNFAIAGLIINYILLPKFLYNNKYLQFAIYICFIVALVIIIEEAVLERIFYPDTRGKRFSNLFFNLLNTMPTLTILAGFKFAWDALKKQKEVQHLKNSVKESELQFLKSQINPHFLFNNMNNLYAHAIEQSPKTPDIILELSAVLRYMLYECKAKYVPLVKEIEQLKNYTNLHALQIEGRGTVDFKTHNISSNLQIAPLIIMVFVENAFKHSASSQTEAINLAISINVDADNVLHFKCSNTFNALSNTQSLSNGIGLENVKKRLELIYPKQHQLKISTQNDIYAVKLTIKLNETT
ncbi:MAG: sensor histidine kinase [Winogradskyella sp.]|uniref:sensor histidine kinase n=1 Tax=Winogradskyella sp. TaxID=1883156 RepID=UPI003858D1B4